MKIFHSLKVRLFLSLFLFLFALIILLTIGVYRYSSGNRAKESEKYFMEKVNSVSLQLDLLITKLDTVSAQLLASRTLQKMFVKANSKEYQGKNYFEYNLDERKTAQDILWTFNSPKRQVESINIFSESTYVGLRYSPSVSLVQELSTQDQWNVTDDQKYKVLGPHLDGWDTHDTKEVISLVRPFVATNYSFIDVGVIEVQEKYSKVTDICGISSEEALDLLIVDQEDNVIFENREYTRKQIREMVDSCNRNSQEHLFKSVQGGINYCIAYSAMDTAPWKVILFQPENIYQQPIRQIMLAIVLTSLLLTVVIFLFLMVLINNITKPVLQLAADIELVSKIDQPPTLHQTSIREVRVLQDNFMQLMGRINDSTKELLVAHETELNLRVMGLQAQINPHFLFNSLTAISAVAKEEKSSKVPIMCYQLSELFRYSSSLDASLVPMKNELDHIRIYLEFMKWRYEDNFEFEIIEQGDLSNIEIARLTLQPVVENCFTHGFKGTFPPYRLKIVCDVQKEGWIFSVADNGIGFSMEMIDKLSNEIQKIDNILALKQGYDELKAQNMAILNIYIRLKLQYKESLFFEVVRDETLKGALVTFIVRFPYNQ